MQTRLHATDIVFLALSISLLFVGSSLALNWYRKRQHKMNVSAHLHAAFVLSLAKYSQLHETWINASVQIGDQLPNSMLMFSVQNAGRLDILLRSMEDEFSSVTPDLSFSHQALLSELWIGHVYEFVRLLNERELAPQHNDFIPLFRDLTLVRIPLEKHEIAGDRKLKESINMVRHPPSNDATDVYKYSSGDKTRSHISPCGMSQRGSLMWMVLDIKSTPPQSYWIERRNLSDRILAIWGTPKSVEP